jgi:sulfotransferase family protein
MQGNLTTKVGYIGGTSFCGSTLLSFLLDAQPGAASIGEVAWSVPKENAGNYQCSCGATLDTCQFWRQVSQEMALRGHTFDANHWNTSFDVNANRFIRQLTIRSLGINLVDRIRDKVIRRVPGWGKHLAEIGKRNTALIESIATIKRASAFIDASKDPVRVRFLSEYCEIEPFVIHLVRDSPAFVNSFLKNKGGAKSFHTAIRWWSSTARRMEQLRRVTPADHWLLVRYEDLCANPLGEIQRVLQFLGVAGAPPVVEFRPTEHHIIGNRMRLGASSEIQLDTSWRTQLSKTQLDHVMRKTRKYRQLFGY